MKYSELFRKLQREGWYEIRQDGSHNIMAHQDKKHTITMPYHGSKEIGYGLMNKILKQAGLK